MSKNAIQQRGAGAGVQGAVASLLAVAAVSCCCRVPESIRLYAAALPARADGQYAMIGDDAIMKSLIVNDAMLQCAIDEEEDSGESSAACRCGKSNSPNWVDDCQAWLGDHTPKPVAPAPAAPAPDAPAPASDAPTPDAPAPTANPNPASIPE